MTIFALILAGCGDAAGNDPTAGDSKGKVVIGLGPPWTTSIVPSYIAAAILEDHGYEVETIISDVGSLYAGLAKGDIHVFMDTWLPSHTSYMSEYSEIEKITVSYSPGTTGWFVPPWVDDIHTIPDLAGNEDRFKGEILMPGAGTATEMLSEEVLAANPDIDLEFVSASESALWTVVQSKYEAGEDFIFGFWFPHALFAQLPELKMLEDMDDIFPSDDVYVVATPNLKEEMPEVYAFLQNWELDGVDEANELLLKLEDPEYKNNPEKLGREWVEQNPERAEAMWPADS